MVLSLATNVVYMLDNGQSFGFVEFNGYLSKIS